MSSREHVRLEAIAFDAGTQIRAAISEAVVTDYAERMREGVVFPPVVLFHDGTRYYMADGFHRALAAKQIGCVDIDAEIQLGTKGSALWYALGANKLHGKQLTAADKRHAITVALQTWPDRSGARIAEQVGCSPMYVSTVKAGLSTTLALPDRVTGRDGVSYPASPSAAVRAREDAKRLLGEGQSVDAVRKATGVGRETLQELRRGMGLSVDKTQAGVRERRDRMRQMAAEGYTSRQMAAELGLSEDGCRVTLKQEQIDVPADKVTRNTKRHDANRIMSQIVADAENLTEGVNLIVFADLDRAQIAEWLRSLQVSRDKLGSFIRRLMKEQQNHGEAA